MDEYNRKVKIKYLTSEKGSVGSFDIVEFVGTDFDRLCCIFHFSTMVADFVTDLKYANDVGNP